MTTVELLAELRSVVKDRIAPYAWSDTRLTLWMSEGQDKFCAKTGYWSDKTTYSVTTVLGQQDYAINPRIISVRSIWDGTRPLLDAAGLTFSDEDFADTAPQSPIHYRTDLETGVITFFETVAAGITLSLRVHRKSKVAMTSGDPEIPEEFQLALVEYAAYKAFGDHDRELQDPVKANDHYRNFLAYCKDGSRAYRRLTGEYSDVVPSTLYMV